MGMRQQKGGVKNEVLLCAWGSEGPNSLMKVLVK